jgi:homoaconitase/3-isopropylmalate dehydratase large subunit
MKLFKFVGVFEIEGLGSWKYCSYILDHYIFTNDERAHRNVDIARDFCMEQDIKYFYDIQDRSNFRVSMAFV